MKFLSILSAAGLLLLCALLPAPAAQADTNIIKTVFYAITPTRFADEVQAQDWLDSHKLPFKIIADTDGIVRFNGYQGNQKYDCDDYAQDLQQAALDDGFLLTEVPVVDGKIFGVKVTGARGNHVGLWTKINGTYYYVEAVSAYPGSYRLVKVMDADSKK